MDVEVRPLAVTEVPDRRVLRYAAGGGPGRPLADAYGFALNGLMLVSTVLDMGTLHDEADGNDIAFVLSLPTFACLAHYHGLLGDRTLEAVRAEAEAFAVGDYARALLLGNRLPASERQDVVSRLARLTGLRPDWIERAGLRIASQRFFRELLRDRGLVIGRLDGRFTGWEADAAGEAASVDPSYSAILGPYVAACNHYLNAELEYKNDLPYEVLTDRVRPWSYKEFEGRQVSVAERLAAAIRATHTCGSRLRRAITTAPRPILPPSTPSSTCISPKHSEPTSVSVTTRPAT